MVKRSQTVSCCLPHDKAQGNDTAGDMESMQAREDVEESTLKRRWKINTCVHQLLPRRQLASNEKHAQQRAEGEPPIHRDDSIFPNCTLGQFQREAAQEQHEGIW